MQLKHFFISMMIGGMLISCGGNKSSEDDESASTGISETIGGLRNLNKAADAAKDWEKTQEKLVTKTPLTNDEIKAVFPETLAGMKRSSFTVGESQMMGVNSGQASYSDGEGKSVEVSVMDGAGETGAAMVAMYVMTLSVDTEQQTETGYTKTTKFNGNRATVSENKQDDWVNSEITTLVSDRYIVSLDASGMSLKELEKVFDELNLNSLK
ncbi:MAG: hypothetical protein GX042_05965 [Bacteroidales bacterium]|jgi:hypothetical protein|nr:hypothetical protein [Bacteroidales bacterium]